MAQPPRDPTDHDGDAPRLGQVVRFAPDAAGTGVRQLEGGGFRVASSRDFRTAAAVPNDFGGADVQYFERFGIAVVRRDGERLTPLVERAMQQNVVSAVRAERNYRALGVIDRGEGIVRAAFDETSVTWGLEVTKVALSALSGAGIKVAVLDTGFDSNHQDFRGRKIIKKLFASKSSEDDTQGHGTHCIGTACGPLHPTSGPRYGIAYEAEIYAGKVLGEDGMGTDRSVIAGMDWALDQGCQVISMSLGAATKLGDQPNADYEQIGQACLDAGTVVIAAAGNESSRPDHIAPVGSPANALTIMAVAALDKALAPAPFSCGGINPGQEVDIAAPGVDVLSSLPGSRYGRMSGTSMATPHASGVAVLIAQSDMKFRGQALWTRLEELAGSLPHPPRDVGKGLLQAPAQAVVSARRWWHVLGFGRS
jgi:subtilisin family serine protease